MDSSRDVKNRYRIEYVDLDGNTQISFAETTDSGIKAHVDSLGVKVTKVQKVKPQQFDQPVTKSKLRKFVTTAFLVCCGFFALIITVSFARVVMAQRDAEAREAARPKSAAELQQMAIERRGGPLKTKLLARSEREVLAFLKAPKTAEFERFPSVRVIGPRGFAVDGTVTAMNSFGVPLTQSYTVYFFTPDDAKSDLKVISLVLDRQTIHVDAPMMKRLLAEAKLPIE